MAYALQIDLSGSMHVNAGREVATLIPDARLLTLNTSSHVLAEGEPAWAQMIKAISEFLS